MWPRREYRYVSGLDGLEAPMSARTIRSTRKHLRRWLPVWSVLGTAALSCNEGGGPAEAGAPTQLAFTAQPTSAEAGAAIAPAIKVEVRDGAGNRVTTATNTVTLTLVANPGAGTLSGTLSADAASGVATFSDVRVDRPGTGYTLAAATAGLAEATSASFNVNLTFTRVDAGGASLGEHTCGVTSAGAAFCWGSNFAGQLGDGSTNDELWPAFVQAPSGVAFQTISTGGAHTCAVTAGGDAYCWGRNEFGRLGDDTEIDQLTPVRVAAPSGVTFIAVSAGKGHSCGLASNGAVYCWGRNSNGELGDGTTDNQLTPVQVQAPPGVTFAAVSVGGEPGGGHSCAVAATSGAVYCWGYNGNGQLGDNTTTDALAPVAATPPSGVTFATVDAGDSHTCALTPVGAAYCWGANGSGQLGDGTTVDSLVPTPVQGGFTFGTVSAGSVHTCAVTTTGAGYCWGDNSIGQIGDGTTSQALSPTPNMGDLVLAISAAGLGHSCGLATGASAGVYCWGSNVSGELGDGTTTDQLVPTRTIQ
jgi:alpha-tubulin suppressor-like RCC1 family protein